MKSKNKKGDTQVINQRVLSIVTCLIILCAIVPSYAITWTIIDYLPGGATAISGDNIIGAYYNQGYHGYLYNGTSWTTLDYPGARDTYLTDIDGSNIIGYAITASGSQIRFLYNGTTWTTLNVPGIPRGISGGTIVGSYGGVSHAYLYSGTTWATIDPPGSSGAGAYGIDGSNIVGWHDRSGFLYNGVNWTTLMFPGAGGTAAYDISGRNIIGNCKTDDDTFYFLYDGATWTILNYPGADSTWIEGIDGDKIIGWYLKNTGESNQFIAVIPEPGTCLLMALGAVAMRRRVRA